MIELNNILMTGLNEGYLSSSDRAMTAGYIRQKWMGTTNVRPRSETELSETK